MCRVFFCCIGERRSAVALQDARRRIGAESRPRVGVRQCSVGFRATLLVGLRSKTSLNRYSTAEPKKTTVWKPPLDLFLYNDRHVQFCRVEEMLCHLGRHANTAVR